MFLRSQWRILFAAPCLFIFGAAAVKAQEPGLLAKAEKADERPSHSSVKPPVVSVLAAYYSQDDGIPLAEIVKRAFENNGDIRIARLEVEKAKARLTQAGLRANPT